MSYPGAEPIFSFPNDTNTSGEYNFDPNIGNSQIAGVGFDADFGTIPESSTPYSYTTTVNPFSNTFATQSNFTPGSNSMFFTPQKTTQEEERSKLTFSSEEVVYRSSGFEYGVPYRPRMKVKRGASVSSSSQYPSSQEFNQNFSQSSFSQYEGLI